MLTLVLPRCTCPFLPTLNGPRPFDLHTPFSASSSSPSVCSSCLLTPLSDMSRGRYKMIPRRFWSRMGMSYSPSKASTVRLAALISSNVWPGFCSMSSLTRPRQPPFAVRILVISTSTSMRGRALARQLDQDARSAVPNSSQRRRFLAFVPSFFLAFRFSCCFFDSVRFRLPKVEVEPSMGAGEAGAGAVADEEATDSGAPCFRGMTLGREDGGYAGRGCCGCFFFAAGLTGLALRVRRLALGVGLL